MTPYNTHIRITELTGSLTCTNNTAMKTCSMLATLFDMLKQGVDWFSFWMSLKKTGIYVFTTKSLIFDLVYMKLSHAMSPLVAVSRLHGNTDTYLFVNGCLFCYKL